MANPAIIPECRADTDAQGAYLLVLAGLCLTVLFLCYCILRKSPLWGGNAALLTETDDENGGDDEQWLSEYLEFQSWLQSRHPRSTAAAGGEKEKQSAPHAVSTANATARVTPGGAVLRIRPLSAIALGTVDESFATDGPFEVIRAHPFSATTFELAVPQGSKMPRWHAESALVPLRGKMPVGRDMSGRKEVAAVRGVRGPWCRVHWEGWGTEDDEWVDERDVSEEAVRRFHNVWKKWEKVMMEEEQMGAEAGE